MSELFAKFEVNKELRWPVISKLLVGSLALHSVVIACVLFIPGVRDAFNLASLIADTKFVDKAYQRTEIGDDVTLIDLTSDKFRYPDGYFAPEGQIVTPPTVVPPFVAQVQPSLPVQPELAPSPSPSPSPIVTPAPTPVPTPIIPRFNRPRVRRLPSQSIAQASPSPNASPAQTPAMTADEAQTELDKTAKKNNLDLPKENEINKKAMKDFAAYALDLKNQGKLDLNQPFEIVIEAELDQDGKLKNPKFTKKAGDPNLVDLFGRMVAALNDSGFLVYLKDLNKDNPGSKIVITVKQGESEVLASVESEASSAESARLLAPVFNKMLSFGADSRKGKDEETLLRNTSAEPNGKKIIFNFTMPRQAVVDLIKKQLADKPS